MTVTELGASCATCGSALPASATHRFTYCAACRLARGRGLSRDGGKLPATCWCEATTVFVPAEMIARALTLTCGRPGCVKP